MQNVHAYQIPNKAKALSNNRKRLPQITRADSTDFIAFLKKRNIATLNIAMPVSKLIPSQNEFDFDKIHGLYQKSLEMLSAPIFVSKDNYIMDGHHRVLALFNKNPNAVIRVNKVGVTINELIHIAHEYEKSFTKELTESSKYKSFIDFLKSSKG